MGKVFRFIAGIALIALGVIFPHGWIMAFGIVFKAGTFIALGTTLALSGLNSMLLRPKVPDLGLRERLVTVRAPAAPRRILLGTTREAGVITDVHQTGTDKLNVILTLSGHEVSAIGNMYFDGVNVPLDGSGDATGTFAGFVHAEKNLGGDNQARLAGLATEDGTHWASTFRQAGCAHVWVRLKHDPDKFPNGLPNITFDVDGWKSYDPRDGTFKFTRNSALNWANVLTDIRIGGHYSDRVKLTAAMLSHSGLTVFDSAKVADGTNTVAAIGVDSASSGAYLKIDFGAGNAQELNWVKLYALAGGSPAQFKVRSSDDDAAYTDRQEVTFKPEWEGWNYVRIAPNGAHRYWRLELGNTPGAGAEFGELEVYTGLVDATALGAAANVCDEDVSLAAGGTEDRYLTDGAFTTDAQYGDVKAALEVAFAGNGPCIAGLWKPRAGAWTAPTVQLNEDDLRGGLEAAGLQPKSEIFNTVRGTFISSLNNWQPSDFPEVFNPAYVHEDGGEVLVTNITLPFTTSVTRAQRIAKILLEQARKQKTFTVQCKLSAWQVEAGEVVQFTVAQWGWTAKNFLVVETRFTSEPGEGSGEEAVPVYGVDLTLREIESGVYSWSSSEEGVANAPGTPTLPTNPGAQLILRPSLFAETTALGGTITNPRFAFDNDDASYAEVSVPATAGANAALEVHGFPGVGRTLSKALLRVRSSVPTNGSTAGVARLVYKLRSDNVPTNIFEVTNATRAELVDEVDLLTALGQFNPADLLIYLQTTNGIPATGSVLARLMEIELVVVPN